MFIFSNVHATTVNKILFNTRPIDAIIGSQISRLNLEKQ